MDYSNEKLQKRIITDEKISYNSSDINKLVKLLEDRELQIETLIKENDKLNNSIQNKNYEKIFEEKCRLAELYKNKEIEIEKWRKKYFEKIDNNISTTKPNLNKVELLLRENEKLNELLLKKNKNLLNNDLILEENKNLARILEKKKEEYEILKENYNRNLFEFDQLQSIAKAALTELESYKTDNEKLTKILEENCKEVEFFRELESKAESLLKENEKYISILEEKDNEIKIINKKNNQNNKVNKINLIL